MLLHWCIISKPWWFSQVLVKNLAARFCTNSTWNLPKGIIVHGSWMREFAFSWPPVILWFIEQIGMAILIYEHWTSAIFFFRHEICIQKLQISPFIFLFPLVFILTFFTLHYNFPSCCKNEIYVLEIIEIANVVRLSKLFHMMIILDC